MDEDQPVRHDDAVDALQTMQEEARISAVSFDIHWRYEERDDKWIVEFQISQAGRARRRQIYTSQRLIDEEQYELIGRMFRNARISLTADMQLTQGQRDFIQETMERRFEQFRDSTIQPITQNRTPHAFQDMVGLNPMYEVTREMPNPPTIGRTPDRPAHRWHEGDKELEIIKMMLYIMHKRLLINSREWDLLQEQMKQGADMNELVYFLERIAEGDLC